MRSATLLKQSFRHLAKAEQQQPGADFGRENQILRPDRRIVAHPARIEPDLITVMKPALAKKTNCYLMINLACRGATETPRRPANLIKPFPWIP